MTTQAGDAALRFGGEPQWCAGVDSLKLGRIATDYPNGYFFLKKDRTGVSGRT
jgi:hypothetical protein